MNKNRINLRSALGIVVSLLALSGIFYYFSSRIDFQALVAIWKGMEPIWAAAAVAAMIGLYSVSTLRFQEIIRAETRTDAAFLPLLRIQLVVMFAALGLPVSAASDVLRVGLVHLRFPLSFEVALHIVLCDRIVGMLGLVACGLLAVALQAATGIGNEVMAIQAMVWGGGVATAITLVVFGCFHVKLPWKRVEMLVHILQDIGQLLCRGDVVAYQLALVLVYTACAALVFWSLALGMHIALAPIYIFSFMPLILFVNNLPMFYLGWGGREAAVLATFSAIGGISPADALALSIGYGGVVMLSSLPGGIFWLLRPSLRKAGLQAGGGKPNRVKM
ncbi:MAG: lysylphosphatidylglycerol synthase transmembrane domain-containing protein [Rhodospirillaceae bacterium]